MAELTKRFFLVDDHPLVREHVAELIVRQPAWTVCGEAESAPSALRAVQETKPDMVILDISLRQSHGFALIKDLQQQIPGLPILVLSMHDESLYALRALRAGAFGYISKTASSQEILAAIKRVLEGRVYLSEKIHEQLVEIQVGRAKASTDPVEQFTDRELEVFQLLGRGCGTRRIAEELRIGIKAVEVYRARIREKLGLSDSMEVLVHAIQWVHGLR
jgi:DNA-binding NarL/FixJ family response regulator